MLSVVPLLTFVSREREGEEEEDEDEGNSTNLCLPQGSRAAATISKLNQCETRRLDNILFVDPRHTLGYSLVSASRAQANSGVTLLLYKPFHIPSWQSNSYIVLSKLDQS